jgi:hypothetical protein
MSHVERLKRYERMAQVIQKMRYYNCSEKEAPGYIPPEWAAYWKRHGYNHPGYERYIRFLIRKESWL